MLLYVKNFDSLKKRGGIMLKKIFKEIGRFILVGISYWLYFVFCLWLESFTFTEKLVSVIGINVYLLLTLIVIPILIALCFWKKSKIWLIDLIGIILLWYAYFYAVFSSGIFFS